MFSLSWLPLWQSVGRSLNNLQTAVGVPWIYCPVSSHYNVSSSSISEILLIPAWNILTTNWYLCHGRRRFLSTFMAYMPFHLSPTLSESFGRIWVIVLNPFKFRDVDQKYRSVYEPYEQVFTIFRRLSCTQKRSAQLGLVTSTNPLYSDAGCRTINFKAVLHKQMLVYSWHNFIETLRTHLYVSAVLHEINCRLFPSWFKETIMAV